MNSRLTRLFFLLQNPWLGLVSGILAGFLFSLLAAGLATLPPNAPGILDLQLAFRAERLNAVLNAWGEAGVQQYVGSMWLDYLYPLAYSVSLASFLAWLAARPGFWQLVLFCLPLLAGALDYVENTLHLLMFAWLLALPPALVFTAALAASAKWLLIAVSLAALLLLGLRKAFQVYFPNRGG